MTDDVIRNSERLAALRRLSLLDTPAEPSFDRLTRLASAILKAPISMVSLIDVDRQFMKSALGLSEPLASVRQIPLSHSVCKHTVTTGQPLIIENAQEHDLVRDNPGVAEYGVVAYAGIPLVIPPQDAVIGSFCVIDVVPRTWSQDEIAILQDLAASVMTEIALRTELIERRQAQAGMKEAEERYKALFERSLDAVFILDFEGHFIDGNNAAFQMSGYAREEFISLNIASLLVPDQLPLGYATLAEIVTMGFQKEALEFRIRAKNGRELTINSLSSVIDRDGSPWAVQSIVRDITAQKQAEVAVRSAYDKEKQLREMRSQFMSMLSHDFRVPLSIIQSSTEILKRYANRLTEAQQARHLETIQGQLARQLNLLNDFLILDQADSVGLDFHPERTDLERFCRDLMDEFQLAVGKTHQLTFLKSCEDSYAWIDKKLLHRALSNLLSNAMKYSPKGGKILLNLSVEGEWILISIQDEGIGIPKEALSHLFEPFYRATNAGSIQGTGLGMVIVKQMVEAHTGTITVESEVGVGTTFTISLPTSRRIDK